MRLPAPSRLLLVLAALWAAAATAQSDAWRAYPAYNEVDVVAAAPDGIWAGTRAGLFFYAVPDGEIVTYPTVDGPRGGEIGAMTYDAARAVLWVGYADGLLERLDPETGRVTPFFAIARADQYPSRGVRRIRVFGDDLYLGTDFGVVVFNTGREEVRDTYARIGTLAAGTPVNDLLEAPRPDGSPGLWVATEGGVYYADRSGANLQTPAAWTKDEGLEGGAFSLAAFDGTLYAGGGPSSIKDLYRRQPDGSWSRTVFTNNRIASIEAVGETLVSSSPSTVYLVRPGQPSTNLIPDVPSSIGTVAVGPDGRAWVADGLNGLYPLPEPTVARGDEAFSPDPVVPPGPVTNNIVQVDVSAEGVLWLVTRSEASNRSWSVSRFEDGAWTTYRSLDPGLDIARGPFDAGTVGPDGLFYAGNNGGGLTVFSPDGEDLETYDRSNSSLNGAQGSPDYLVVRGVGFEGDRRWVTHLSTLPLHLFAADGSWTGLPFPSSPDRIPSTAEIFRIAVDPFGQKWLALGRDGLGVWDTGADPESPTDDRSLYFTGSTVSGQGLPNPDVRDVVVDLEGRVWIGTARGIAYVFSPGSAFGGGRELATPQWARTADGTSFLLRDVAVNDLEVDPAGQIWVGTTSGAYLINAAGDGLVRQITSANSPLPSDAVFSVAVDPRTGRVYLTTSEGLFSLAGDATQPRRTSEALTVAPSPFRPAEAPGGVVVTGLRGTRSNVRVLTVGGEVVYEAEVAGGSFRWTGRNSRTGRPVPSGVYLVSAAGDDGSTLVGKVALIR